VGSTISLRSDFVCVSRLLEGEGRPDRTRPGKRTGTCRGNRSVWSLVGNGPNKIKPT
jgi:hypothetical protein